jgi:hypothetical protein
MCVAFDDAGLAVAFPPADPANVRSASFFATGQLQSLSCPSTSQCTAIAAGNGWTYSTPPADPGPCVPAGASTQSQCVITFDPATMTPVGAFPVPAGGALTALVCTTTTMCVGAGYASCAADMCSVAGTATFDPLSATGITMTPRGPVGFRRLACASSSICTAMDPSGTETTFDPGAPGVLSQVAVDPLGDYSKGVNGASIACPSISLCVLATWNEPTAISFAPLSPGSPRYVGIDDGGPIRYLACPSEGECVGLGVAANPDAPFPTGAVALFEGGSQNHVTGMPLAPLFDMPRGLACPTDTQCTAVTGSTSGLCNGSWSCPGTELTFNPRNLSAGFPRRSERRLDRIGFAALACVTAGQCTAIDGLGRAVTFAPRRKRPVVAVDAIGARGTTALACVSRSLCTAADRRGRELSFDPLTGTVVSRGVVDRNHALSAVSCPTTMQCSAVDGRGSEVTFNPGAPGTAVRSRVDTAPLTGISCPSTGLCVATDALGRTLSGDPRARREWAVSTISGAAALLAVACPSTRACVEGDASGRTFVGRR